MKEFTEEVIYYVWNEWSRDYIQHTDITTRELLEQSIDSSNSFISFLDSRVYANCSKPPARPPKEVSGASRWTSSKDDSTILPNIYIIYLPRTNTLVGFCFIEEEDPIEDYIITQLHPWLSNVYIIDPFRKQGYGTLLLQYVLSIHNSQDLYR